jgi:hypothetical protein
VLPAHIEVEVEVNVKLGWGLIVTLAVLLPVQPAELPVTVYCALELPVTVTVCPVVLLNPVAGLQV